ncbi:methyl-accepting chemotaxis protein [Tautonia plasticadhaerens]|uniref:Methyl-accepting chemotaxis protein McpB n=1 Tax=Tautonia plasticadhaerens TaxID=2527974 RepID=A0A518GUU7_9BACT|nr:methyl-accepting chemotaxis protein [Tautonia plasticadhaerens]QDV32351.1 Methyl-accepting chemotaxis protein McpB [Tautonia plasticadhaerens]
MSWSSRAEAARRLSRLVPRSIAGRLTFWFLAIALVPCLALTTLLDRISSRSIAETVRRNLGVIQAARATELEQFAGDRIRYGTSLSRAPAFVATADRLAEIVGRGGKDSPEYRELIDRGRETLTHTMETLGYPEVVMFSPDGTLLLRSAGAPDPGPDLASGPLRGSPLARLVVRTRTLLMADLSAFATYPGSDESIAFVGTPLLGDDGRLVGVLALQLDNRDVFRVFSDHTGLGETGEVLVGALDRPEGAEGGRTVTIVSPLRHATSEDSETATVPLPGGGEATVSKRIRLGSDRALPLQEAVLARRGYGRAVDYRGEPTVAAWGYLPSYRWGLVVKQDADEAFELIARQRTAMAMLLGLTAVGVVTAALLVAGSLARPIRAAAEVARRIAVGDLTGQVDLHAEGEPGQLLAAFRTMTEYLRGLIGRMKSSSVQLLGTATTISAASRQQEQSVQAYGASTNQAAAAVKQITATSQELLGTMNDVNEVAAGTGAMAAEGHEALVNMDHSMRILAESTGSISSRLSVISERANNINLVVTTITKVADQTNLLSINAAIEAEKAGEYGRGFLVVAREIRRLADQTAVATLDIERMVKEMQQSVSAGVMEMDKFHEQVRQGVEEVNRVAGSLGQIIDAVRDLTPRFEQVTDGMRAQALGAEQIREAMVHLSEGAGQSAASLREFNDATERLRQAVGTLRDDIAFFKLEPPAPPVASGGDAAAGRA